MEYNPPFRVAKWNRRRDFLNLPRATISCWGNKGFHALEVKNTAQARPEDLRGLKSFGEDYPESRRWLLYRGRERLLSDGILCLPCGDFLANLIPDKFPPR